MHKTQLSLLKMITSGISEFLAIYLLISSTIPVWKTGKINSLSIFSLVFFMIMFFVPLLFSIKHKRTKTIEIPFSILGLLSLAGFYYISLTKQILVQSNGSFIRTIAIVLAIFAILTGAIIVVDRYFEAKEEKKAENPEDDSEEQKVIEYHEDKIDDSLTDEELKEIGELEEKDKDEASEIEKETLDTPDEEKERTAPRKE